MKIFFFLGGGGKRKPGGGGIFVSGQQFLQRRISQTRVSTPRFTSNTKMYT